MQYVQIHDTRSKTLDITCGVPQGSTLGPLLFLLYVNDMPNCSNKFSFRIFADDTNLFYASDDPNDLSATVNNERINFSNIAE